MSTIICGVDPVTGEDSGVRCERPMCQRCTHAGPSHGQQIDMLLQQLAHAERLLGMMPAAQRRCYETVLEVESCGFVPSDTWHLQHAYVDRTDGRPVCRWQARDTEDGRHYRETLRVAPPDIDGDPYEATLTFWASPDDKILSRVTATADGVPEVLGAVGTLMVNAKLTARTVPEHRRYLDGTPK